MVKTTFLPLPFALKERLWVQTLRPVKKFTRKFISKRWMFFLPCQLFYQIFRPHSFHQETQQLTSFLSSFLLFNIMAKITSSHQVFLSFSIIQYTMQKIPANEFLVLINPLFAITPAGSGLNVFRSSKRWKSCR